MIRLSFIDPSPVENVNITTANMSSKIIPRQLLRRQLCQPIQRHPTTLLQPTTTQSIIAARSYAAPAGKDEKEGGNASFRGQIYQSTNERVQRERAEEERFARYREAQKSRSSAGIVVPIGVLLPVYV